MTEPVKGNEHIRADEPAFMEALGRARKQLAPIPGVVSVGFGLKQTGGAFGERIAIVVFVQEKKSPGELPDGQQIPQSFEGYPTDVRTVPRTIPGACENAAEYSTISGGIQIVSGVDKTTGELEKGTLGCVVRRRQDPGRENVYLLTNKHVVFRHGAKEGDYVYHPWPPNPDSSKFVDKGPSNDLGPIQQGAYYDDITYTPDGGTSDQFFIDCAFARINIDSKCCGSTCTKDKKHYDETIVDLALNGANTISDVRSVIGDVAPGPTSILSQKVFKVGRTTGKTQGTVVSTTTTVNTNDPTLPGNPAKTVHNNIEIIFDVTSTGNGLNCKGLAWFADQGDSGSIVVDEQSRVIGLISQVPPPGSPNGSSSTACHILPVLDTLGICIPTTTGTSHGSTKATDGSGLTLGVPHPDIGDFPIPDGEIVFASDAAAGPFGMPAPVPVSDEEERYMRGLLERLRLTRRGRELHDLFGRLRREAGYLVRNHKLVKVAWNRHKGPAFMALTLDHIKGNAARVPREVGGVSVVTLLTRMAEVLTAYGSNPLREAIETHRDEIAAMLACGRIHTVDDCLAYLEATEADA